PHDPRARPFRGQPHRAGPRGGDAVRPGPAAPLPERRGRVMAGFTNPEEARAHKRARSAWLKAECRVLEARGIIPGCDQPSPVATAPIPHQEGSPMWHGYRVAIPAGWKALSPVFYPVPAAPDEPAQPGIPAALLKGSRRFRAGV